MELAVFLITKSHDVAEKMCAFLLKHPESTVQDAFQNVIGQYGEISKTIKMDNATHLALSEACMTKQINFENLIEKIRRCMANGKRFLATVGITGREN